MSAERPSISTAELSVRRGQFQSALERAISVNKDALLKSSKGGVITEGSLEEIVESGKSQIGSRATLLPQGMDVLEGWIGKLDSALKDQSNLMRLERMALRLRISDKVMVQNRDQATLSLAAVSRLFPSRKQPGQEKIIPTIKEEAPVILQVKENQLSYGGKDHPLTPHQLALVRYFSRLNPGEERSLVIIFREAFAGMTRINYNGLPIVNNLAKTLEQLAGRPVLQRTSQKRPGKGGMPRVYFSLNNATIVLDQSAKEKMLSDEAIACFKPTLPEGIKLTSRAKKLRPLLDALNGSDEIALVPWEELYFEAYGEGPMSESALRTLVSNARKVLEPLGKTIGTAFSKKSRFPEDKQQYLRFYYLADWKEEQIPSSEEEVSQAAPEQVAEEVRITPESIDPNVLSALGRFLISPQTPVETLAEMAGIQNNGETVAVKVRIAFATAIRRLYLVPLATQTKQEKKLIGQINYRVANDFQGERQVFIEDVESRLGKQDQTVVAKAQATVLSEIEENKQKIAEAKRLEDLDPLCLENIEVVLKMLPINGNGNNRIDGFTLCTVASVSRTTFNNAVKTLLGITMVKGHHYQLTHEQAAQVTYWLKFGRFAKVDKKALDKLFTDAYKRTFEQKSQKPS